MQFLMGDLSRFVVYDIQIADTLTILQETESAVEEVKEVINHTTIRNVASCKIGQATFHRPHHEQSTNIFRT